MAAILTNPCLQHSRRPCLRNSLIGNCSCFGRDDGRTTTGTLFIPWVRIDRVTHTMKGPSSFGKFSCSEKGKDFLKRGHGLLSNRGQPGDRASAVGRGLLDFRSERRQSFLEEFWRERNIVSRGPRKYGDACASATHRHIADPGFLVTSKA